MKIINPEMLARASQAYNPRPEPRISATDDAFGRAVAETLGTPRPIALDAKGKVTLLAPEEEKNRRPPEKQPSSPSPQRFHLAENGTASGGAGISILV